LKNDRRSPRPSKQKGTMKKLITFAILNLAVCAQAQWIVYDPTMNTQQIIDQAENVAKYVEMIDNQVQQINTLTSQLQQLEKYNAAFGNPATVLQVTGVSGLIADLDHPPVGQSMIAMRNGKSAHSPVSNSLLPTIICAALNWFSKERRFILWAWRTPPLG
jgi:hypothetical protein